MPSPGKRLSIAAYPPPTRWHPFPEVHWQEACVREVAGIADGLAFMMYDSALQRPEVYGQLMAKWTRECLDWSRDAQVRLGVPTCDDADSGYHHPRMENLHHALRGIHAGLAS